MSDESQGAVLQLLEDSWEARERTRASRRELLVETAASLWFLAAAGGLALAVGLTRPLDLGIVGFLVLLYALVARVEFPVGSGYVVPTQLVLLPMLVLLPPAVVAPAVAGGLVAATAVDAALGRVPARRLISAVPDAWHALGAAAVLALAGTPHLGLQDLPLMAAVFAASCVTDLASSMLRMAGTGSVPKLTLQVRVMVSVWAVDGCLAPLGFAAAVLTDHGIAAVLLVTPLAALLWLLARDRQERVQRAHDRLRLLERERARLQSAVRRLGDAFAARLQLDALLDILLHGAVEALDANSGQLDLSGLPALVQHRAGSGAPGGHDAGAGGGADQPATYTAAVAMQIDGHGQPVTGELRLRRNDRAFDESELGLLQELVSKAAVAASAILATEVLREQAVTDALTGLGNRRRLGEDLETALRRATPDRPALLMLFDLDGFKSYNDTFGHLAGDKLLTRLGARLAEAVAGTGGAYRLGGDEFCVLLEPDLADAHRVDLVEQAAAALVEHGDGYSVGASVGSVLLPHEADRADQALQLADQRMYGHKRGRKGGPRTDTREDTRAVLVRLLSARQPAVDERGREVPELVGLVAQVLGLRGESLDEVVHAAELRDVGNVGIPDSVLTKSTPLDEGEWDLVRRHTTLGHEVLAAAPVLQPVAALVRASHERWDGTGYPDRLAGSDIPLGARIIAVCDAYAAMTAERPHRPARDPRAALHEVMSNAGSQFDPTVVAALCVVLDGEDAPTADDRVVVPVDARLAVR